METIYTGIVKKLIEQQCIGTAKGKHLDHLGLLHDIPRLPGETDDDYRKRILDINDKREIEYVRKCAWSDEVLKIIRKERNEHEDC